MDINFDLLLTQIVNALVMFVRVAIPIVLTLLVISHFRRLRDLDQRVAELENGILKETAE